MKAVSLFSGAGGFEQGFDKAGIKTVIQVESDPWCQTVLQRHYPEVARVSDVRDFRFQPSPDDAQQGRVGRVFLGRLDPRCTDSQPAAEGTTVDLVYGGFPCQDVSVAGKRAGFAGERSSLWFEFERVLSELRPRWAVVENVPGLLSSSGGRDFARVLMGLGNLGYGWAYRVLDAKWFGVPQRRRRVFLVGCLGDAARAAAVLAVCESCGGHPQTRREAGQDVAPTLDDGARRASVELPMIAASLSAGGHPGSNMPGRHHEDDDNLIIQPTLSPGAHPGGLTGREAENGNLVVGDRVRSNSRSLVAESVDALTIRNRQGISNPDVQNFLVASPDRASDGHHGYSSGRGDGADNLIAQTVSSSYAKTTASGGSHGSQAPVNDVHGQHGVRRLTPRECERLQGWQDDWTRYTAHGKEISDSHRYRMIGNGVASPVAEWIGHRLMLVNGWVAA